MKRLVLNLFNPRTYLESLYLLLDLPVGVALFTIVVTLLSVGAGMAITLVGIPILAVTVVGGRAIGAFERTRSQLLLAHQVEPPRAFRRTPGSGSLAAIREALTDTAGWKAMVYSLAMLPWGITAFTITVVMWSVSVSLFGSVFYLWAVPGSSIGFNDYVFTGWERFGISAVATVIGFLLLLVVPPAMRGLTNVDRALVTGLLGRGRSDELVRRVETLTESRDASVTSAAAELARLERDLHDGAQQRLVGLAMELGIAKERLTAGESPERVLPLVTAAHDSSKQAIAELRELVRGIQPGVLTDRGLDAALSGLAAKSPIPVEVHVDVAPRPAAAIESAAYFVVAEALTNAAKHSRASRIRIDVRRRADQLRLVIDDDGVGGATIGPLGGLGGMRDRIAAVEGRLRIASPPGGPTTIVAELPCAS